MWPVSLRVATSGWREGSVQHWPGIGVEGAVRSDHRFSVGVRQSTSWSFNSQQQ